MAGVLDGTGLVGGHMAGGGSQHALPALQHGGDDDGVGLGAAGDEEDVASGQAQAARIFSLALAQ